jgi:hypothetical protein
VSSYPTFPEFKPIDIEDRELFQKIFWKYQPLTSEFTFTNLFMWRSYYQYEWSIHKEWLLILCNPLGWGYYFLQPVGPSPRTAVTYMLLEWLRSEKQQPEPCVERADERFAREFEAQKDFVIEPLRDHFDYVYLTRNLIQLAGRKYHGQKNRLNKFIREHEYSYESMTPDHIDMCVRVLKEWCNWRDCQKSALLRAEFHAVNEALLHFHKLQIQGGVVFVDHQIEGFALGEMLNEKTAVVHIEKVDPKIPEMFVVVNQLFAEKQWSETHYINREQDLGKSGLRRAKESYHPIQLMKKFRVQLNPV